MPTGYTADIENGISFKEFALGCARNFGALVLMRDAPGDAEIPDEFKPSDYNQVVFDQAKKLLLEVEVMTQAQCEERAMKEFEEKREGLKDSITKNKQLRDKYNAMLEKVNAYIIPSPDHAGLKKFMQDQITESISFDCAGDYLERNLEDIVRLSGDEWRESVKSKCLKDMTYHHDAQIEENNRTADRNRWIKQLKDSLK